MDTEPFYTFDCDACGKRMFLADGVYFENTPDGGYLTHQECPGSNN